MSKINLQNRSQKLYNRLKTLACAHLFGFSDRELQLLNQLPSLKYLDCRPRVQQLHEQVRIILFCQKQ
jgi:hypothetical protein